MKESNELEIMQEIGKKDGFVLVLFSSPMCGICKIAEQYLEAVLPKLPEFPVFKCIIDNSPAIVEAFHVTSAPSFKLFVDGKVMQTLFGLRSADDLYYTLKNYVRIENDYENIWAGLPEEQK